MVVFESRQRWGYGGWGASCGIRGRRGRGGAPRGCQESRHAGLESGGSGLACTARGGGGSRRRAGSRARSDRVSSLEDFPAKVPSLPALQAVRELPWTLSGLGRGGMFGVPRTRTMHDCPDQVGVGGQAVVYHRNVGGGLRKRRRDRSGLWDLIGAFPRSLRLPILESPYSCNLNGLRVHASVMCALWECIPRNNKYYYPRALPSSSLSRSKSRPQDRTSGWRNSGRVLSKNGCRDVDPLDRSYSSAGGAVRNLNWSSNAPNTLAGQLETIQI